MFSWACNCQFSVVEAFGLSPEDILAPKISPLGLAHEGPGEEPSCFLQVAGCTFPHLVEATASFLPPDAESHNIRSPFLKASGMLQSLRTQMALSLGKRKLHRHLSDPFAGQLRRIFYFESIRQKWDIGKWYISQTAVTGRLILVFSRGKLYQNKKSARAG